MFNQSCLGVVLAGGLSSRMGEDKANLQRNSENMLTYSKQLLRSCKVDNVVVSGDQHEIADSYKTLGPLAGIYSVIEAKKPQALLILPIDLPLMTSSALAKLKQIGELTKKAAYYQSNYLPIYLPINAFTELSLKQIFENISSNNKGPSMRQFISAIPHTELTLTNNQQLFNCNTPDEWQQAKQIFTARRL